ncbi:MAG: hypothetical protein WAO98_02485 [Alphaproteobacteria bacterium]
MPVFSNFEALPFFDQLLHGAHFMLCSFAVLIACIPMLTEKGSPEHKFGGFVYLPLSIVALTLASYMAWRELSLVLFCFNCFCLYLLMSGWRAVHENETPSRIDWLIPSSLFCLSMAVAFYAVFHDSGMRTFYLLFFAMNAFYLSWRDYKHLKRRTVSSKNHIFLGDINLIGSHASSWIGRHIAGMVGSVIANLSVVVLTLLPLWLHWLWPTTLLMAGLYIAHKEREKKLRVRQAMATILQPKFRTNPSARKDDDIRRAA